MVTEAWDMVTEAWDMVTAGWYIVTKRMAGVEFHAGTPNLHLFSYHLRRCNLSNESNCIVCRDAPLEFLNVPWCPSTVIGIVGVLIFRLWK